MIGRAIANPTIGRRASRGCAYFPATRLVACTLDEEGFRQNLGHPTRLAARDGVARTAICLNALERLWDPQPIVQEIDRVLTPGGIAIVISTAAGAEPAGNEPAIEFDGQPLQPRLLRELLSGLEATVVGWQGSADDPHTVLGIGFKAPISATVAKGIRRFLDLFPADLARRRALSILGISTCVACCRSAGAAARNTAIGATTTPPNSCSIWPATANGKLRRRSKTRRENRPSRPPELAAEPGLVPSFAVSTSDFPCPRPW